MQLDWSLCSYMLLEALGQRLLQLLFFPLLIQTVLLDPVQLSLLLLLHALWSLVLLVLVHGQVQGIQHVCNISTRQLT